MTNRILKSTDPELLELLKKYDDYIDDYVEFPKFITQYLKGGEIIRENLSCETEAVLTKELDSSSCTCSNCAFHSLYSFVRLSKVLFVI